jgi:hypothetical protein
LLLGFRTEQPVASRFDCRRVTGVDELVERNPVDVLHHEEVVPLVAANAVDRHDVRVVQSSGNLGFTLKSLSSLRIIEIATRQYFECDATCERELLGLIDNPHASPSDLTNDAIIA